MKLFFQPSYTITISTLYFMLLMVSTLRAKPIDENITDHEIDPVSYLRTYGYLKEANTKSLPSLSISSSDNKDNVRSATSQFQQVMGLRVTGVDDEATKRQMRRPRCGVADPPKRLRYGKTLHDFPIVSIWDKTSLTYRFGSFASYKQISRPMQESILDDAFDEWSKHVSLTFERVCETCLADIVIEFVDDKLGNHFHGEYKTQFRSEEIAHAIPPSDAYSTYVHFNKKFNYTESYDSDTSDVNLFYIAVHEIGHTLGLDHLLNQRTSVMYPGYFNRYGKSREDYLTSIDQQFIRVAYDKRKMGIITTCSTWSVRPKRLHTADASLSNTKSLSINQDNPRNNNQLLTRFMMEHRYRYDNASHRFTQQNNNKKQESVSSDHEINRSRPVSRSILQVNHFKSSGSVIDNGFGQAQSVFLDRFDNYYVSDYYKNRVLRYDTAIMEQQRTIIAENLNAPRALYVTNDNKTLFVVDNKGVHRFKIGEREKNLGASTLLFCLDSSSEIYNMIVDEDDFNTIYLYDTARGRIQRCRHLLHTWQCQTIVNLTAENDGISERATMLFDAKGDLSLMDTAANVVLQYEHDPNGCKSMSDSSSSSSTKTTASTPEDPELNSTCSKIRPCLAENACCSAYGYCGNTSVYCGTGCLNGPCYDKKGI